MNNLKFSIITVCYNSERTIERTIQSVLAQTYLNCEYLIVDGASTDRTLEIANTYKPLFKGRMHILSEPDNGLYDAMNKGIHLATGDVIGIVNSDDWLESDALDNVAQAIKQNNGSMDALYCGWISFHYMDGSIQKMKTSHTILEQLSQRYEMGGVRHPAVFVPKQIYEQLGSFDDNMKVMADTDLILRYYFAGVKFRYIEKIISNMSDGGVSNRDLLKAYNDYRMILRKYTMSKVKYYCLSYSWGIKRIIKSLIPTSFLYFYRSFSKA